MKLQNRQFDHTIEQAVNDEIYDNLSTFEKITNTAGSMVGGWLNDLFWEQQGLVDDFVGSV